MTEHNRRSRENGKQMVAVIVIVVVAAAIIFAGSAFLFTQFFSGNIKAPVEYETVALKQGTYAATTDLEGQVEPTVVGSIVPESSGTVKKVNVCEGQVVKRGDVLMVIKNKDIEKALEAATAAYEKTKRARDKAAIAYNAAADVYNAAVKDKNAALKAAQKAAREEAAKNAAKSGATSSSANSAESPAGSSTADEESAAAEVSIDPSFDKAVEDARTALDKVTTPYNEANARNKQAQSSYQYAKDRVNALTIKAGEAGTVVNLRAEKGAGAETFTKSEPAMQIVDYSKLKMIVRAPEDQVSTLYEGQPAEITVEGLAGEAVTAKVSKIGKGTAKSGSSQDSQATSSKEAVQDENAGSGEYRDVTLSFEKKSYIKAGMKITAKLELHDYGTVYFVPKTAVAQKDDGMYVQVVYRDKTTTRLRVMVVGELDDDQYAIKGDTLSENINVCSNFSE